MEDIQLNIVHPVNVEQHWPELAPWILQAVGEGVDASDVNYIKMQATTGQAQIWVAMRKDKIEAVLVTETAFYGGRKTLVLRWLCGTERQNWLHFLAYIENWAETNQYERTEAWIRKGLEKVLRPYGYSYEFTVVGKSLMKRIH